MLPGGNDDVIFADRASAGRELAAALEAYRGPDTCVLALVRGGVPVAFEVAKALHAPLDIVLVRKIGAPFEPELGIAAVVDGDHPELVVNERLAGIAPPGYLAKAEKVQLKEIERRRNVYLHGRAPIDVRNRTVILVDDGIATGTTIAAALRAARKRNPRRLIVAVPVAPAEVVEELREEVDDVVCLAQPQYFGAIGPYYGEFAQVDDVQVQDLLRRSELIATAR